MANKNEQKLSCNECPSRGALWLELKLWCSAKFKFSITQKTTLSVQQHLLVVRFYLKENMCAKKTERLPSYGRSMPPLKHAVVYLELITVYTSYHQVVAKKSFKKSFGLFWMLRVFIGNLIITVHQRIEEICISACVLSGMRSFKLPSFKFIKLLLSSLAAYWKVLSCLALLQSFLWHNML